MMKDNPPTERPNPFQLSQDLMQQTFQIWEQLMSQYMDALLRNQQFMDMTGKALEHSLQFKQQIDRMVEMAVANMQLPTRNDQDRSLSKLNELEGLLRDVNEKLDRLLASRQ